MVVLPVLVVAHLKVQASAGFDNVEQHFVYFDPAIVISTDEPCSGVLRSPDSIVTSSECARSAWKLIHSGAPVRVLRPEVSDNTLVGQLPDLSQRPFARLLQRAKSDMLVPYIPALSGADSPVTDFPLFFTYKNSGSFNGSVWLLQSVGNSIWQAVVLRQQETNSFSYSVFPVEGKSVGTNRGNLLGHPVSDEKGQIVCLIDHKGECHSLIYPYNDGSCHIPHYFQCNNVKWEGCTDKDGWGACFNSATNQTCTLRVFPNHFDYLEHCLNSEGCGTIFCPHSCYTETSTCTCVANWGFCELTGKIETTPPQCMISQADAGSVDFRCNRSRFLGVVIGVPVAIVTVMGIAISLVIIYKCRHPKYERIN